MITLLALLLAASAPVRTEHVQYYDVTGSSANELRESIDRNRIDPNGEHYDGHTTWTVSWKYRWQPDTSGACALTSFEVLLDVRMILPQWQIPDGTSSDLRQRWTNYVQALRTHEDGHVQNGDDAAAAVGRMIASFGTRPTCKEIDAELKVRGDQILQGFLARDVDYDRDTRHGETQGAVFP